MAQPLTLSLFLSSPILPLSFFSLQTQGPPLMGPSCAGPLPCRLHLPTHQASGRPVATGRSPDLDLTEAASPTPCLWPKTV